MTNSFDVSPLSGIPFNRRQHLKVTPQSIVASNKKAVQREFRADLERMTGSKPDSLNELKIVSAKLIFIV
jgi:hypothetical protein